MNPTTTQNGNETSRYGFACVLTDTQFGAALDAVAAALKTEGFGVLTEIDVQATMQAKLGIDGPAYRILGACNPRLAHRAISAEPDIGLLLPCNVVVRSEADRSIVVSFMDPVAVMQFTANADVHQVAEEVHARLQRVRAALVADGARAL